MQHHPASCREGSKLLSIFKLMTGATSGGSHLGIQEFVKARLAKDTDTVFASLSALSKDGTA